MNFVHSIIIPGLYIFFLQSAFSASQTLSLVYPEARRCDQIDIYHGVKVADPYRWLEDPNSAETKTWINAENKLTSDYFKKIPYRQAIRDRYTKLYNYESFSAPIKLGGRYFFLHNNGLQNHHVFFVADSLNAEPHILLDPNTLSTDGSVSVANSAVSNNGKFLAYGIAKSGSDWVEWHVRDVDTGKDLPDTLKWIKFSEVSWSNDNKGFFYSRYDKPKGAVLRDSNYFLKLFYHQLGTSQSEDKLVYERPDNKELNVAGTVSDDGHFLIISVTQGISPKNALYYQDLTQPKSPIVKLFGDFDAQYSFIGNNGPLFWIKTDRNAPHGRLLAVDIHHPEQFNWKTIIPENINAISFVNLVNNYFFVGYLRDASSEVRVYALNGTFLRNIDLPGIGTVTGFNGRRRDKETFFNFTNFIFPSTVYRYDIQSNKSTVLHQPKIDFDSSKYETKRVFYRSKDGTRVPMFLTYKKGIKLDGQNPVILFGYGGFNFSLAPNFSVFNLVWFDMGGVFAQPSLRGGEEYGEVWHKAGTKLKKQNVFDDFIAAAEWLIRHKYTSPSKLAISGRSNGGLLVGACVTQRPDLFGAALPDVGVMDMLRFEKFTIGWSWIEEYGSSKNIDEFKALYAYSPLHNLKSGTKYPATLISTSDHDDRVVPAHSFKFAATMQADQAGTAPILLRVEKKAGHGAGKSTYMQIEEDVDKLSFIADNLRMEVNLH